MYMFIISYTQLYVECFIFRQQSLYVSPSFPTISSSGPNGAIIHYQPSKESSRQLSLDEPYLCDSGCQFRYYYMYILSMIFTVFIFLPLLLRDGTTDVTRTMHFGMPTEKQKVR